MMNSDKCSICKEDGWTLPLNIMMNDKRHEWRLCLGCRQAMFNVLVSREVRE